MAELLPNAVTHFDDNNGNPLAGGSVFFYIPGTSTFKSTYQDSAQSILNTNPVILNARGEAIIWGAGTYRQVVYDNLGNLIWDQITEGPNANLTGSITDVKFVPGSGSGNTFIPGVTTVLTLPVAPGAIANTWMFFDAAYQADDQIASLLGVTLTLASPIPVGINEVNIKIGTTVAIGIPPAGSVTDISVASGANINASKLGFLQAGIGAVMRTVLSKLRDEISFMDFGAVGDGVTDNTAAINAALGSGLTGKFLFPPGTYVTTGNHTLQAGQYIVGAGKNVSIVSNSNTTNDTFKIPSSFCGVADLTITGTAVRSAGTHINALGAPSHTYISRVSIFNFADAGVKLNGVVQYLDELDISIPTTTTGSGILISGGGDQYINGITFDGGIAPAPQCLAGIQITQNGGVWLTNCDFIHPQIGVLITAANVISQFMFFSNVACDTCSNNGWLITTSGTGTINDCAFVNCWGASAKNSGLLVTGVANSINGLAFANSRFIGNGADGIFLQSGCLNVMLNGGLISGNSLSPTLTSAGIHIGAGIGDISIAGMRIGPSGSSSDTQLVGILADSGAGNRISITGCDLSTAQTPINFQASGTNNTISGCTGVTLKGRISTTTDTNGHVVVTHNNGSVMGTVLATVENGATLIVPQWTGASTTTNFALVFFGSGGAPAVNTAVTFSWLADF